MVLALAACGSEGAEEPQATGAAPVTGATETAPADPADGPGRSVTLPATVCDLFEGIDPAVLIGTTAGGFVGSDDECSVPAADPLEFAQASITIGVAPAIVVIRNNYEGPLYECPVVDIDGLGDQAFSCLGGSASSHVVFAAGEYLVIFSAGNNVAGPPSESLMLDSALQILENMGG